MDSDLIARNLKCVEKHFHSEAVDEVEAALDLYSHDIVWELPPSMASIGLFPEKRRLRRTTASVSHPCAMSASSFFSASPPKIALWTRVW
jgi:hypothetical protein